MNPTTRTNIGASAALVIAVAVFFGNRYLAAAVAALICVAAIGWPSIMRIAHHKAATLIMIASGAIAVFAVAVGRGEPYLRYAVAAAAAAILLALASEVFFPSPRGRAVASVSGLAAGGLVAVSAAAWLASARTPGARDLVIAAAVCLAVTSVASTLTSRANVNGIIAVVAGAALGLLLGSLFDTLTVVGGVLIGVTAAVSNLLIGEIARREPAPRKLWAGISSGVTPVLIAGALVYIGGRLLVG
ncbi:MAG: hypothetical protein DIU73_002900 [Actinomycetes bacterium]|nr:MAG: hypothetical protein DIU73_00895 [Actinomycetota bacterium]